MQGHKARWAHHCSPEQTWFTLPPPPCSLPPLDNRGLFKFPPCFFKFMARRLTALTEQPPARQEVCLCPRLCPSHPSQGQVGAETVGAQPQPTLTRQQESPPADSAAAGSSMNRSQSSKAFRDKHHPLGCQHLEGRQRGKAQIGHKLLEQNW